MTTPATPLPKAHQAGYSFPRASGLSTDVPQEVIHDLLEEERRQGETLWPVKRSRQRKRLLRSRPRSLLPLVLAASAVSSAGCSIVTDRPALLDHAADPKPGHIASDQRACHAVAHAATATWPLEYAVYPVYATIKAFTLGLYQSPGGPTPGELFDRITAQCMRGRGHNPLDH